MILLYSLRPGGASVNCTIHGSDNDWVSVRRQAITWTNDVWLLIRPFGTIFNEILIEKQNV